MYKLIILAIFVSILSAQNPIAYSALGDVIYDNMGKIKKLKNVETYKLYIEEIDDYINEVEKTKKDGFLLSNSKSVSRKKEYLNKLRELSKRHDSFFRSAKESYRSSIKDENSVIFSQIINSGLIDTIKNKKEIIDYYFLHSNDISESGVIQQFLEEDARLKRKKKAQSKRLKTVKILEKEKIKRIRNNDKKAQEELEKKLQKQLNEKKLQIREKQKKDLAN